MASSRVKLFGLFLALAVLAIAIPAGIGAQQEGPQNPAPAQPPEQPRPAPSQPQVQPGYGISITVPVVNVDVVVTDDDGNYLNHLKKENFRVLEDGQPQTITNFSTTDAPITVDVLLEYSSRGFGWYLADAATWADAFLGVLKPTDWVALETFQMKPNIEVDFTHDRAEVEQALSTLIFPAFHEANLFDAVVDTSERMKDVKGKKAILLLASGTDTFSKLNLDKTLARLKGSDTPIYCVGVAEQLALQMDMANPMGMNSGTSSLQYLQAQNQLRTFAKLTGGRAWFPRFDGEIPGIMRDVAGSLRSQYSLGYTPSNQKMDGTYRKIKVELVAPDGGPLTVLDQKGKKHKFQVYAREGYVAPTSSVGD